MSDTDIEILLSSDSDYEELIVEIFYKSKFVALLNQDAGVENLKVEFPSTSVDENMVLREIDFDIFQQALSLAKAKLKV